MRVFTRIAKSNSVLVSKKLAKEDRKNLLDIIQSARLGQALLEVAAASDKRKEAEYRKLNTDFNSPDFELPPSSKSSWLFKQGYLGRELLSIKEN